MLASHIRDLPAQELTALLGELVETGEQRGVRIRALGGLGVWLRVPETNSFRRESFGDLDIAIPREGRDDVEEILADVGLVSHRYFNVRNRSRRQIWWLPNSVGHVDVFVGTFSMCHSLSFEDRFPSDHTSLFPADLLLTKLQIIEINEKDLKDSAALLDGHELADDDENGCIGLNRLKDVLSKDWGFYTTVLDNLSKLAQFLKSDDSVDSALMGRVEDVMSELSSSPKSTAFRLRAKIGRRKRWYALPEEPFD
jgi:hypothetical protein